MNRCGVSETFCEREHKQIIHTHEMSDGDFLEKFAGPNHSNSAFLKSFEKGDEHRLRQDLATRC